MRIIQIDLNKDYSEAIKEAINVLKYGGVIVYPTDTLYGLGANALNPIAVRKIFKIKKRDINKPLPVMVKSLLWAQELAHIRSESISLLEKVWPGKVTAVLSRKEIVPDDITAGNKTVGLRVADHPLVDELLGKFGYPMTATSANISGDEPSLNINNIISTFEKQTYKPDLILDVGILPSSAPSTILDLTTDKPKILRVGAAKPEELLKLLEISS